MWEDATTIPGSIEPADRMSGPTATFRLSSGGELALVVSFHQAGDATLAADIAFRFLQRLSLTAAGRLEFLLAPEPDRATPPVVAESRGADPTGAALERPEIDPFALGTAAAGPTLRLPDPTPGPLDPRPIGRRGLTGDD